MNTNQTTQIAENDAENAKLRAAQAGDDYLSEPIGPKAVIRAAQAGEKPQPETKT